MKAKGLAALLIAVLILNILAPLFTLVVIEASASDFSGTITECAVDRAGERITVRGSIKHGVLVNNRDCKLGVFRFEPWVNVTHTIKKSTPLATMDMTIRFEFSLPCRTIADRLSQYAVAIIDADGTANVISEPRYADMSAASTSSGGFKCVLTEDVASSTVVNPGSAIVDVYLDKLDKGNKSGYIFNADGELFYFDRDVIKELDKKVLSYTAAGADVYFRFLISPFDNDLPFCSSGNLWATNKCVVIGDAKALNAIYAYTFFLISRYDGGEFGRVDGIILGRGADLPIMYNYAALVSEAYASAYARSLTLIGIAALEAAGDSMISLIVPIGDMLSENGVPYASTFLTDIAEYIDARTDLSFTVMCESRHNPYKLTDSMFSTEIPPEASSDDTYLDYFDASASFDSEVETTEDGLVSDDSESATAAPDATDETTELPPETTYESETTVPPETERNEPTLNTNADGYYCTDNIGSFLSMFNKLKKNHASVNPGFAWCWYPDAETSEGALGACYSYNYMKLAAVGADFYAVSFEDEVADKFSSIAHLFKYIDTTENIRETAYARAAFGIDDWSELISDFSEGTGVFSDLREGTLEINSEAYRGAITYFDYSELRGTGGWFGGLYCTSLGVRNSDGTACLQADMDLDASGVYYAEIGYLFDKPEPLLLGDALTFDIKCGDADGSLYEVAIYICCGDSAVISKAVVSGGERNALSVDVSDMDNTVSVESMRILLKRVTGEGGCKLDLYSVALNSSSASDAELVRELEELRNYLNSNQDESNADITRRLLLGLITLTVIGAVLLSIARGDDMRRRVADTNNQT